MSAQTDVTATVQMILSATCSRLLDAITTPTLTPSAVNDSLSITVGTGAAKANCLYADRLSIAPSGTAELAIGSGGTFLDAFGTSVCMAKLKAMVLINSSAAATTKVTVFGDGVTDITDMLKADGDGFVLRGAGGLIAFRAGATDADGWAVAASETILFTNEDAGNAATVDVYLIGEAA